MTVISGSYFRSLHWSRGMMDKLARKARIKVLTEEDASVRVKKRIAEARNKRILSVIERVGDLVASSGEKNFAATVEEARKISAEIESLAIHLDAIENADIKGVMAEIYVWTHSLGGAPTSEISRAIAHIQKLSERSSSIFSSAE